MSLVTSLQAPHVTAPPLPAEADPTRWRHDAADRLAEGLRAAGALGRFRRGEATDEDEEEAAKQVEAEARDELRAAAERLAAGKASLGSWRRRTRNIILPAHQAATLALLGESELTPADAAELWGRSAEQVAYLDRFRDQVAAGIQLLDGTLAARAELYGAASWSVAWGVLMARKIRDGYTLARSVLGASDHCAGCLGQARLGWQPIGAIVPIGRRDCGPNCHCRIEVR